MGDRLPTIILVTLITAVVWLFAEADSLGGGSEELRIRFVAEDSDLIVEMADSAGVSLAIDFRAPRGSIAAVRERMAEVARLQPGSPGVPSTPGQHTIDMLGVIAQHPALAGTGAQIDSVRPQTVTITIVALESRDVPLAIELEGVAVEGSVNATPATARLRLPSNLWDSVDLDAAVIARPTSSQIDQLPISGPARVDVQLALSPAIRQSRYASLATPSVRLEFSIRDRNAQHTFGVVPVMITLPPIETRDWVVTVDPQDQILSLTATGPSELIERLRADNVAIIADLLLSSEELDLGLGSKAVQFFARIDDRKEAIPPGVTITPSKGEVRFTVERVER